MNVLKHLICSSFSLSLHPHFFSHFPFLTLILSSPFLLVALPLFPLPSRLPFLSNPCPLVPLHSSPNTFSSPFPFFPLPSSSYPSNLLREMKELSALLFFLLVFPSYFKPYPVSTPSLLSHHPPINQGSILKCPRTRLAIFPHSELSSWSVWYSRKGGRAGERACSRSLIFQSVAVLCVSSA